MPFQTCALPIRSEEHTSELQSHDKLVCRLLLEKKTTLLNRGRGPQRWNGPSETGNRHRAAPQVPLTSTTFYSPAPPAAIASFRCFFFFLRIGSPPTSPPPSPRSFRS